MVIIIRVASRIIIKIIIMRIIIIIIIIRIIIIIIESRPLLASHTYSLEINFKYFLIINHLFDHCFNFS